ncbi:MAG: glycosyltransferase [Salibacteraceae bacterium]|nr:glycosyltransferase [Salibacteraceae bacterium]MDP4764054.1 glycosyltransferase [Salibacteraceae bacterium]MDP4844042.1 glycosyltransferase [Salibacteraceae bacterium]
MSLFADVYYNNQPFNAELEGFGLEEKEIVVPPDHFDLYIVRNNFDVFSQIKGTKFCLAYPYNEEAFRNADAVLTTTQIWKERLEQFNERSDSFEFFGGYYPETIVQPKQIINIGQVLADDYVPKTSDFKCFQFKAQFGYGFTVAYFGRVDNEAKPHPDYLSIIPELEIQIPELKTVFAGNIRVEIPSKRVIKVGKINYQDMVFATSACDVLLCNEHDEANWLASGKTLEAIGCEVPIVLTPRPARVEQLGADYPLFYNTKEELLVLILKLYRDSNFRSSVKDYMRERAKDLRIGAHSARLEKTFKDFLNKRK